LNGLLRAAPMKDIISTSKADHPSFSLVYTHSGISLFVIAY
jgi:hypothetical protein